MIAELEATLVKKQGSLNLYWQQLQLVGFEYGIAGIG